MKQIILIFAFFTLGLFCVVDLRAADLTVTKTADTNDGACDADCSLREAIAASVSGDTVVFSELFNSPQTITLAGTNLVVDKNLTINGTGADLLKISAGNLSRVFKIPAGFSLTLVGMTVSDGNALYSNSDGDGGGIWAEGNLTIENCIVRNNQAMSDGAGIFSTDGTLNIIGSIIRNNLASGGMCGGVCNRSGVVTVTNSSISNNAANVYAGGIKGGFSLTITNSSINNNSSGIGAGGGIMCGVSLNMSGSTISGNRADFGGGGVYCEGPATIANSTISDNVVSLYPDSNGGGIWSGGNLSVTSSTITNNSVLPGGTSAGGIFRNSGTVSLRNSIVAANFDNANVPDIGGVSTDLYFSSGYNLIGNVGTINGFDSPTDKTGNANVPLDPMLDPLGNYGGPTLTHRLRMGSPAIDQGNSFSFLTDQRGFSRTFDFPEIPNAPLFELTGKQKNSKTSFTFTSDGTDIGAYERSAAGISGRVTDSLGMSLQNVRVVLSDASGNSTTVVTGSFGYYHFSNILVGETYTIRIAAKGYQFTPYTFTLNTEISDLIFAAQESY